MDYKTKPRTWEQKLDQQVSDYYWNLAEAEAGEGARISEAQVSDAVMDAQGNLAALVKRAAQTVREILDHPAVDGYWDEMWELIQEAARESRPKAFITRTPAMMAENLRKNRPVGDTKPVDLPMAVGQGRL